MSTTATATRSTRRHWWTGAIRSRWSLFTATARARLTSSRRRSRTRLWRLRRAAVISVCNPLARGQACQAAARARKWCIGRRGSRGRTTPSATTSRPTPPLSTAYLQRGRLPSTTTTSSRWDTWLLPRVDGQFTGTTDEIFQWAACKWGLSDDVLRAIAVRESTWYQYLTYPSAGCYWLRGCGDAFSSITTNSITYCNGIAASGGHDYQIDPVTSVGGYPYRPTTGLCPTTFSILGIMSWDDPAWQGPYPAYAGNQNGTFPFTRDSTAAAADYWGAWMRGCYEGWITWMNPTGGDIWGCAGAWYSGDWYSTGAASYITQVQYEDTNLTWLTASFDDSTQQYQCDPQYGCPS